MPRVRFGGGAVRVPVSNVERRLHAAMVGIGNPYRALTPARLPLLPALLDHPDLVGLAEALDWSADEVRSDLATLAAAGIVALEGERARPLATIADASEVARVAESARRAGALLAEAIASVWPLVEAVWPRLDVSRSHTLAEMSFLLVGDRLLDVGLLDALAVDGRLMPPAPPRQDRDDPTARYYLCVVEGEPTALGQYGQRATALPWPGWSHLTFGRYGTPAAPNATRARYDERLRAAFAADPPGDPAALAWQTGVPYVDAHDARVWDGFARALASELVGGYYGLLGELTALFESLRVATLGATTFGEFFCWYDHLAYAHAIDALVAAGRIVMPAGAVTAAIWHEGDAGEF